MAYINQDMKKRLVAKAKEVLPKGWKVSFGIRDHQVLIATISSAPVDLIGDLVNECSDNYVQLTFGTSSPYFKLFKTEANNEILDKLCDALNSLNHNNSNSQVDYFDVGYYTQVNLGNYKKHFEVK